MAMFSGYEITEESQLVIQHPEILDLVILEMCRLGLNKADFYFLGFELRPDRGFSVAYALTEDENWSFFDEGVLDFDGKLVSHLGAEYEQD